MVEQAKDADPLGRYQAYDGGDPPFEDACFDAALAVNVLHHVPPPDRQRFASRLGRVVRPGGFVIVIEHTLGIL